MPLSYVIATVALFASYMVISRVTGSPKAARNIVLFVAFVLIAGEVSHFLLAHVGAMFDQATNYQPVNPDSGWGANN